MKDPAKVDLLREVADAFNRHDLEAILSHYAESVELTSLAGSRSRSWSSTPTEGSRASSSTIGIHRSAPGGRRTRTEGSGPVVGWPPQVGEGHETVVPPGRSP